MARLLGERLLPSEVNSRRRELRRRVNELRRPIKRQRRDIIPGPDVIQKLESAATDARNTVTTRETIMSRISSMRADEAEDEEDEEESGEDSGSGDEGNSPSFSV